MEPIASLQNNRVKLAYSLQKRARSRRKERKIALEGVRLIRDACERHKPDFILYEPQSADYDFIAYLQGQSTDIVPVTLEVMQHISGTQQPQGIVGVFPIPMPQLPRNPARILILDAVRDPGNMGAILRTAAAAGVEVVLLAPGSVDPYNPKVLRGGMGAHFRLPIVEAKWERIGDYCTDMLIYLADGSGEINYTDANWSGAWALIIGSEAHGASAEAAEMAQERIRISMAAETESLNAAVAAGVILFEARRQQNRG